MSLPIPDGATWPGSVTGREWTSHGTSMTRSDFLWDGFAWKVEFALPLGGVGGGWDSYVDYTGRLESFSVKRSVTGWYLGPRASTGNMVITNDEGDGGAFLGSKVKITVTVPSGDYVIYLGLVNDRSHFLTPLNFAKIRVSLSDWLGYEGTRTVSLSTTNTDTATLLVLFLTNSSGNLDAGWPAPAGMNQNLVGVTSPTVFNVANSLSQIVRGDLGMLFVNKVGDWQYEAQGWYTPNPTTAVAAFGSDGAGVPPDAYTYRLSYSKLVAGKGVSGMVNSLRWDTQAPVTPTTSSLPLEINKYGLRYRSDTLLLDVQAEVASQVADLMLRANDHDEIRSLTFPAQISQEAMEYAARAELTDFINVAYESLEDAWSTWYPAFVTSVQHTWSAQQGWNVTLGATRDLYVEV